MGLIDAQEQSETSESGWVSYLWTSYESFDSQHGIATCQAYGGLFFRHLAVYAMINNPGVIEVVYLGKPRAGSSPI